MKILKTIFIILIILIIIGAGAGFGWLQYQKPQYKGEVDFTSLHEDVQVRFDEFGVPHIYATNKKDAFTALGYVHAQDRLFQMEMLRRVGAGRLSEILGKDFIETDKFFRTLGIDQHSKASVKEIYTKKSDYLPLAEAYLEGINIYIENEALPAEFKIIDIPAASFSLTDVHNSIGYMAFSFAQAFRTEPLLEKIALQYGEDYVKDLVLHWDSSSMKIPTFIVEKDSLFNTDSLTTMETIYSVSETITRILDGVPVAPFLGSNSWVIAPQKTASGKVILANDTHIGFAQPSVWYEAHIETPGFSFYGNFLAGVPFPMVGHNQHHGIGLTMFENDDIDLYYEKVNPENDNEVWVDDHWETMKIRQETIQVKDGEPIQIEVKETRHGPLVNEVLQDLPSEKPVSTWWVYTQFLSKGLEATYKLMAAKSMDEAREAASLIHAPGLNVMYGDVDGNIAWWASAKLPKRPAHVNPKFMLDGASGKDEVEVFYDFTYNPKSENPPNGFVYSANNQPDSMQNAYHYGYYIPGDRAERIVQLLEADNSWDIAKIQKMMLDDVSPIYPQIAKEIVNVIENTTDRLTKQEKTGLQLLKNWDGNHQLNSNAAVLFHRVFYLVMHKAMVDEIGEKDFDNYLKTFLSRRTNQVLVTNDTAVWWDNINTDKIKESRNYIFTEAYKEAVSTLSEQLGEDMQTWQWQQVHSIEHPHPLGKVEALRKLFNVGPYPISGATEVINNQGFIWDKSGQYKVTWGPAMRRIIDFGDSENSVSILPTGQSGNVMSSHYKDQAEMFVNGQFRKQRMNKKDIKANSTGVLLLRAK